VEHFEAALRMKPDHLPAHTRLAWSLEQLGRHQQAIAAYERVRALAPRNPEVARLARELGLAPR
jgi:Flp pilus assembly protein TadD